jgi:hypothetical protein
MQAAMEGHVSVTAFTELNYARIALKIGRDASRTGTGGKTSVGLPADGDIVRGGKGRIQHTGTCTADRHEVSADDLGTPHPTNTIRGRPILELRARRLHPYSSNGRPHAVQGHVKGRIQHLPPRGGVLPLRLGTCRDQGAETERAAATMEDPALCLFALFARRFELARATCRTTIGGTEAAMRMVAPDLFGSNNKEPHRGLVMCWGRNNPVGPETQSFTASGLTKITLPHGCTAETDTHIFAAADDGFSRSENDYTISYVWPFNPSTLTPGLDTKRFSDILKRNLNSLANNTRHNIPLEIALQAVGATDGVPMDLNSVLDGHHYVTVPVMTIVIIVILVGSVVGGVIITRTSANQRKNDNTISYMAKELRILGDAVRNREEGQEEEERNRQAKKPTAPQPPSYRHPVPPPYAAAGRGRPGYSTPQSLAGMPGYSLGASASLVAGLQEHEVSTAGHSLGMQEQAAAMLGGFQVGRDQVSVNNFPRGAPAAINMSDMMERQ